jgi:hypothetical protein
MVDDFGSLKSVHMIQWPTIKNKIDTLSLSDHYAGLHQRMDINQDVIDTAAQLRQWLSPIVDLSGFPHAYHVNGTHSSIERWLAGERRVIYCLKGEYPYAAALTDRIITVDSIDQISTDAVVYMSNPFSSSGKYDDRYQLIKNPVILDIAYVGTTDNYRFDITPNTEQVFWSASKCFGLGCFRTGYRFTRVSDPMQDILAKVGYTNWLGVNLLRLALNTYGPFDTWQLLKDHYHNILVRNNMDSSHSYLLGLSCDQRQHAKFAREDGTLRVPVGRVLDRLVQELQLG